MLSGELLSQLSTLKKDIRASRDVARGTVRGSSGRYGFVSLDDGRDAFLTPDQMDKVFHGDRVEVLIETKVDKQEGKADKEQYTAKLEKLIYSPLKQLAGRYCVRGKGHFVIIEIQQHTRWVFVPPNARANAKDGEYVTARVTQHPYETGKAQARVTSNLGLETNAKVARQYTLALHQLYEEFSKEANEQAKALLSQKLDAETALSENNRTDLRSLPLITIDSANTRDMDDAICIETTASGWKLQVAIADPSSEIPWESPIDHIALLRAHTLYLPGKPVPMLPEGLSVERYSLISGVDRLALVATLDISNNGEIKGYSFEPALIQSKAKLSYQQVSAALNQTDFTAAPQLDDITPFVEQLSQLKQCAEAMLAFREENELVTEHNPDFMLILNNEGKIDSIEKIEKSDAHIIIEEAMLATNQSAGAFLAQHNAGLFSVQMGYRDERRDDIEKLLKEILGEENFSDTAKLDNFKTVIRQLQQHDDSKHLLAKQQRFQQASELSLEPGPHFGLGKQYYANITSPIRRFQDIYNHRAIFAILNNKKPHKLRNKLVDRLKEAISNNRLASRVMEQWLIADYLQSEIGETFTAYIALLTNQGIGVRLIDTGIEGFILGNKQPKTKNKENPQAPIETTETPSYDKISFNNQRMELSWNETELFLNQQIEVKLTGVDMDKKKPVFEWVNKPS